MNPHKKLRSQILAALAAVGLACSASAAHITVSPGDEIASGNQTSQSDIDTIIGPLIAPSTEVYKADVATGGGVNESGSLATSYTTVFSPATDPSGATITYDGGAFVQPTAYALVKDGSQEPAWYLFNLTALGWDGTHELIFANFWPDEGAISHITLYGGDGPTGQPGVPDGGATMGLLGLSLLFVEGLRRKLNSA